VPHAPCGTDWSTIANALGYRPGKSALMALLAHLQKELLIEDGTTPR
jgi:hypothetical protein